VEKHAERRKCNQAHPLREKKRRSLPKKDLQIYVKRRTSPSVSGWSWAEIRWKNPLPENKNQIVHPHMNPNKLLLAIAVIAWLTITAHAQSFLTNGLVAFYPFKGNANDVVGTNNGVIYGGVTLAPDRFGSNNSAYLFNGVDGYIDIGSPIGNAPANFTETAWVDIISRATNGIFAEDVIITKRQNPFSGESWADLVVESSVPDAGAGEIIEDGDDFIAQCLGTTLTPTNVWFFIGEVCTNDTYQLYVNGSLENTIGGPFQSSSSEDMTLMHEGAWGTYSHGMLDDVRIYNRPLSSNEMEWLYASEGPPQTATATATLINGFVVGATITAGGPAIPIRLRFVSLGAEGAGRKRLPWSLMAWL
jgi:Concanavalin A-like lectin/glucanases superfamily